MNVIFENSFTLTNVNVPISATDMEHPLVLLSRVSYSQFSYDLGTPQYDLTLNPREILSFGKLGQIETFRSSVFPRVRLML